MIKKLLLTLVLCLTVMPAQAASQQAKDFSWLHPGAHPLTQMPIPEMVGKFADLMPKDVGLAFQKQLASGPGQRTTIPQSMFFLRMLFGKGQQVPRVFAEVSKWPAGTPLGATMYTVVRRGLIYVMVRPDVCGNWALAIIDVQGHCIKDKVTCTQCSE